MRETWRWFGPNDAITLPDIVQTGAQGIVTALHEIPYGQVWSRADIAARKAMIEDAGLSWDVVESLPVHEDIKRGQGDLTALFDAYRQSMINLAAEGVRTICYNFMPLLDWTRTTLDAPVARGGTALRFSAPEMAYFDIYMLQRTGAQDLWSAQVQDAAADLAGRMDDAQRARLLASIMSGLPGAYARYDIEGLRQALAPWAGVDADALRANLARFLAEVIPTAHELGVKLAIHPDDPPRPLLGLPRIVSTGADIEAILAMHSATENGLTLCAGSLGAHPDNDVPALARQFADRIHFAHLRNVAKEPDGSFQEAPHLAGDTNMPAVIDALLDAEVGRDAIPFRPDHGHALLDDDLRKSHPGYPLVGRLRGLAELRGVIAGLQYRR